MIYILTFVLAMISVLYEFTLAQLIALFFGSTFKIYAFTIGIYTFSLGLGSLFYESWSKKQGHHHILLWTEWALSISALISPFVIVLLGVDKVGATLGFLVYPFVFFPVFLCGFFSGVELPCLMDLKGAKEETLLFDYMGMFLGGILFGTFLLDYFGPVKIIWMLSFMNIASIFIFLKIAKLNLSRSIYYFASVAGILLIFILNEEFFLEFFRKVHGV